MFLAVGDQLSSERRCRVVVGRHLDRLHDRLHLFAEVLVGDTDDGDVGDLRVHREDVLRFLRVHVHAARDDHVRLAVGEVEEAVLVDLADVAEGRPAVGEA